MVLALVSIILDDGLAGRLIDQIALDSLVLGDILEVDALWLLEAPIFVVVGKLAPRTALRSCLSFIETPKSNLAFPHGVKDSTKSTQLPILKVALCDRQNVVLGLVNQWVVVPSLVNMRS